jgi:4-amino-4-deoxy-L-arabinose transferase-like glycosyltransferase
LRNPSIQIRISGWTLLLIGVAAVIIFFRFSQISQIPGEPFSDHAEKLLDVSDVLAGKTSIFFPRNTGREAIQFYWTAAIIQILGTGISFISLKIGTVLIGLLTLPYIYLLGKEFANRRVALLALFLAGIAYWPNVISRIGLRFPLYPLFAAPTLYYFFRGLRTANINDYLLAGIALGLGLHGYSPARIVPFVLVILFGVYLLHAQARGKRSASITAFILLAAVSFLVFLPLFRYMVDNPDMFGYRALTRLGTTERPFPGPVGLIFLSNLWNAVTMFFWTNGDIWVHSVVNRPALDVVTAALLFSGEVLLLVRYLRNRRWQDILMLLSIPLLMMPSILSLAFPNENPSLNRTGGAIVPVFITAAVALDGFITAFWSRVRGGVGRAAVVAFIGILLSWSMFQNYDLVFRQFKEQFMQGAWNTYEIGKVVRSYAESVGTPDTAYVVPYPYWVDTRLVGINAGYPDRDYALWPESFPATKEDPRAKLFILKQEDQADIGTLKTLYPTGRLEYYQAMPYKGKDFWMFFVPPEKDITP